MASRKERLREKYDLTFGQAVESITREITEDIEGEMNRRLEEEFAAYRMAREAEIQNRLSRFRYDQENDIREKLDLRFGEEKQDWVERLETEFQSRERAAKKAIMSEIDAQMRNERLTFETDLDLIRDETTLELEVDMEDRLKEFRVSKEGQIASQLEQQLSKREEIMRNKALIEIRRKESQIRAEIEAQLGLKRAEIKDRLGQLGEQMDAFRGMAESKMRESIEQKMQMEIDADAEHLSEKEKEFARLQSEEGRIAKQQSWLSAIAGQPSGPAVGGLADPSKLGARADPTTAAGGRAPLGGLARQGRGPVIPELRRRPLAEQGSPMARPVQQPLDRGADPTRLAPVQRVVRQPVQPPVQSPAMSFDPRPDAAQSSAAQPRPTPPAGPTRTAPEQVIPTQSPVERGPPPNIPSRGPEAVGISVPEVSPSGKVVPARSPVSPSMVPPTLPETPTEELEPEEVLPTPVHKEVSAEKAPLVPITSTVLSPKGAEKKAVSAPLVPVEATILTPSEDSVPSLKPVEEEKMDDALANITPVNVPVMTPVVEEEEVKTSTLTPVAKVMTPQIPMDDLMQDAEEESEEEPEDEEMDSMIESMSFKAPSIAGVESDEDEETDSPPTRGPPLSAGSRGPPSGARRGPPPGPGSRGPPSGARRGPPPGAGSRGPPSGARRGPPDSESRDSVEAESSVDDSDSSEEE